MYLSCIDFEVQNIYTLLLPMFAVKISVDPSNFMVVGFGYAVMALYAPSKMVIKIVSYLDKISSILFTCGGLLRPICQMVNF